jgi:hypothetical protein
VGIHAAVIVLAVLGLAAALAVPLARSGAPIKGHLVATPTGAQRQVVDRFGLQDQERDVTVEVTLTPAGAARSADWFEVLAWQGGGQRGVPLVEVAPGRYRSAAPIPTGGGWKAQVYLARGDVLVAMPIVMPVDPQYRSPAVPLTPVRDGEFVPAQRLLTSETHAGPPWVAALAYAALLALAAISVGLLMLGYRAVAAARR